MKRIIGVGLICAALAGDEIERIESIVNDVTELRANYELCRVRLSSLEQEQNGLRSEEAEAYKAKIADLEKALADRGEQERLTKRSLEHANMQISQLEQLVSEQKRHIATLNTAPEARVVTKTVTLQAACPERNPFPQLKMKEEPLLEPAPQPQNEPAKPAGAEQMQTVYFEPSAFRVSTDADICDAPGGSVVERWEASTSFTSNQKRGGWIRITGYFVDRQWRPNKERELWVKEGLTLKR
jgi:flagellar biosynthesis chaperone FliJ